MTVQEIINKGDPKQLRALFSFDKEESDETVIFKFNLWSRYFFPKYFSSLDAPFHNEMDSLNLSIYRGRLSSFVNIAFRGASKTARTKLFRGFVICNDRDHIRRYLKVLSEDGNNSCQIVTDIYNMLVNPRVSAIYPEIFEKTVTKREETMSSFTTTTGIKVISDTVGTSQRGAIQEESRPDEIWFEDFESRKTLHSAIKTKTIWDNMEEARTGLSKNGGCIYTCNYISEQGNVHILVTKESASKKVLIIPIMKDGKSTWPSRYSLGDIKQMEQDDDDFEGERMCQPSASKDIFFDRESLEKQIAKQPVREVAGFKIFKEFNPSHRYGSGHDVAGGVGLDSSTSCFIDFDVIPAQVVATFKSNTIRPDNFGDEINRESNFFSRPITGVERNNHGHATIARARQLDVNLFFPNRPKETTVLTSKPKEYGWHTNALTKPKMFFAFAKAVEDGLIILNDQDLINETKSYTRNDLIDDEIDPRLSTRHFDLLISACIAWQMKDYAKLTVKIEDYKQPPWESSSNFGTTFEQPAYESPINLHNADD